LRNLQVLAESTQRLSEGLKSQPLATDWRAIVGFRNTLVHNYMGVDLQRVWLVVENRLPALRQAVDALSARPE
jgi:uncharacterized protein with HEPN domain